MTLLITVIKGIVIRISKHTFLWYFNLVKGSTHCNWLTALLHYRPMYCSVTRPFLLAKGRQTKHLLPDLHIAQCFLCNRHCTTDIVQSTDYNLQIKQWLLRNLQIAQEGLHILHTMYWAVRVTQFWQDQTSQLCINIYILNLIFMSIVYEYY